MTTRIPHPVRAVLRARGWSYVRLAGEVGRSDEYVRRVIAGMYPASPGFRADVAQALDLPESVLFNADQRQAVGA